jgi:putative ATP-binding cassette transporter
MSVIAKPAKGESAPVSKPVRTGWGAYFRNFLRMAGPYWNSEHKWMIRGLTVALLSLTGAQAVVQVALNLWTEQLFDAFGKRSMAGFIELAAVFAAIIIGQVFVVSVHLRIRRRLEVGWRAWLTERLLGAWLLSGRQHLIDYMPGAHDNPDGRIAEDIRIATEYAVDLVHSLFYCTLLIGSFASILWSLSGPPEVMLGDVEIWLPGHLLWIAIAYAMLGAFIALLLGPKLVRSAEWRQSHEATFRFGLGRVRQNGLLVALLHGEADERRALGKSFADVIVAWNKQTDALTRFTMFTATWAILSPIFPILIAAPRYITGAIALGALMQIAQAFLQMVGALSWPIDNLTKAADWRASGERVLGLRAALEGFDRTEATAATIAVATSAEPVLAFRDLSLADPDGTVKITGIDLVVQPGDHVLVSGDPEAALRLFKAAAGLWPWGGGAIDLPADDHVFFMPQRPYFPHGTLAEAISYPAMDTAPEPAALLAALARAGLAHLESRLDQVEVWDQALGASEQQRLGFARLLLHRPRWIFIQQATDGLDLEGETEMLALLAEEFPEAAVIMVADHAEGRYPDWRQLSFVKQDDMVVAQAMTKVAA